MPDDDETERILEGLATEGHVAEATRGANGERRWYLTEQGRAYVEKLVKTNPEAKAFLDDLLSKRN